MLTNQLKELRVLKRVSQQDVANSLCVSRQVYNNYELGKREPDYATIMKLSNYFGVTIDYLLGKTDASNKSKQLSESLNNAIRIPVLGRIPAGLPVEAIEDVLDFEEVPADWGRGGREYFALLIKGNSMWPKYLEKDIVLFQKADDCDSGNECAVIVNGDEATFKKVIKQSNGIVLQPLNTTDFMPVFYSNDEVESLPVQVIGVAKEIRRQA